MPDGRPGGVIRTSQLDWALGLARHSGVDAAEQAPHPSPERGPRRRPPPTPVALGREDERTTLVFIGLQLLQEVSTTCTQFGEEPVFPA